MWGEPEFAAGLDALRRAVALALAPERYLLLAEASVSPSGSPSKDFGDAELAVSSEDDEAERTRLIALVELARGGDKEAFGLLYDHYKSGRTRLELATEDMGLHDDATEGPESQALGRSDGAIKQLQLRGIRNLAKSMPEGLSDSWSDS